MQTLRIFISSPGDVSEERDRARQVIEQLRGRYAGRIELSSILWEDLPLQPDVSFQQGIDLILSAHGVDIAVFILWSRLGSPMGARILKEDGSEYRSGTERELDLMLKAREQSGGQRPDLLVYTRQDEASFEERLRGNSTREKDDILRQKLLVESFIKEEFYDSESETNVRAFHQFDRPSTFSGQLRIHLQALIEPRVGVAPDRAVWDVGTFGSPFLGLEAFQPEHAPVFFGREDEILEIRRALRRQALAGRAFVMIAGASGSGKSSLARAGVLPAVTGFEIDETISHWVPFIVTPGELGGSPFEELAIRLAELLPGLRDGEDAEWAGSLAADLRRDPDMAVRRVLLPALAAHRLPEKTPPPDSSPRLFLLIDQMEELLSSAAWSAEDRLAFAALLESLAHTGKVWVLATLRADFLAAVQTLPPLVRLRSDGGQTDLLPPEAPALSRLIAEPARLAALHFEEEDGKSLADAILRDASALGEPLPLTSHLLSDLFEHRTDRNVLTFARYREVGGVAGALARHADATLASRDLDDEARDELGVVLRQLVTVGGDDEAVFVRQYPALCDFSAARRRLLDVFIAARLFTAREDGTVTLSHEALLRTWLPAKSWVEANADFLRIRSRIASRIKEGSPLLGGDPLLEAAKAFLGTHREGFTQAQQQWIGAAITAAEAAERRTKRRLQTVLAALSALTLLAFAGAWLASKERSKAQASEASAQRSKATAEKLINSMLFDLRDKLEPLGRLELLDDVSKQAEEYFRENPAADSSSRKNEAAMWSNRGDVLSVSGNLKEAREAVERSLEIRERLAAADPGDVGAQRDLSVSYGRLGDIAEAEGDLKAAREALEKSVDILNRLAAEDSGNAAVQRDLSLSHDRLGDIAEAEGDLQAARTSFERSLEIRKRLEVAGPLDVRTQRDLSVSHDRLGDIAEAEGDLRAAREAFETSLEIRERLAAEDPRHSELRRELGVSYGSLGGIAKAEGDLKAARDAFERSLEIRKRLAAEDPANVRTERDLSVGYGRLGDIAEAEGDLQAAREAFERSLEIRKRLAAGDPRNARTQRDLSVSYGRLGDIAEAEGDLKAAREAFEDGLEILDRLAVADPANARIQRDLSISYGRLGDIAWAADDLKAAVAAFGRSLEIRDRLAAAEPLHAGAQRDLVVARFKLLSLFEDFEEWESGSVHRRACHDILQQMDASGMVLEPPMRSLYESLKEQLQNE